MSEGDEVKGISHTLRVVPFSGDRKDWRRWSSRFLAAAHFKGFAQALAKKDENLPAKEDAALPAEDAMAKLTKKAIKENLEAYSALMLSVDDNVSFSKVDAARTTDWPSGLAYMAWKNLKEEFEPSDTLSRIELKQMLTKTRLDDPKDDPDQLFDKLTHMVQHFKNSGLTLDKEDLIAQVINVAPKEYMSVLTSTVTSKGDDLTVEDLRQVMKQYYRTSQLREEGNQDNEIALIGFKGKCNKCGKQGHKAAQCRVTESKSTGNKANDKNKNTNSVKPRNEMAKEKFDGNCFNCGKKGHRSMDCWLKEENKAKRPTGFVAKVKTSTDTNCETILVASVCAQEVGGCEYAMTTLAHVIPDKEVNKKSQMWVIDSGSWHL